VVRSAFLSDIWATCYWRHSYRKAVRPNVPRRSLHCFYRENNSSSFEKIWAHMGTTPLLPDYQWRSQGGSRGPSPPILQTKHKHTYKLHKICQFGQFIFGKIVKIVATYRPTRSHLLKLKCTKFNFGWGQGVHCIDW